MIRIKSISTITLLVWLGACAGQNQQEASTRKKTTDNTLSTDNGTGDNANPGSKTTPNPKFNSVAFFEANVSPVLKANCEACHVGPRVPVDPRGPQTIYNHDAMYAMLNKGETFNDSELILKVQNKIGHNGGDMCQGSLANTPCKEFQAWWEGLYGPVTGGGGGFGEVLLTRYDGLVNGYALHPDGKDKFIDVEVYIDAAADAGGKLIQKVTANTTGADNGNGGSHAFTVKIPATSLVHGKTSKVYVYSVLNGTRKELRGSPANLTAYMPQAAGQTFYNASIASLAGKCTGCHSGSSYAFWWSVLAQPSPDKGGSATNNSFRIKACGGGNHSGGNQCGGADATNAEEWWRKEFVVP